MNWYDREGYVGLGDRFIAAFHFHILHVQQKGEIYRVVYSDFRRVMLKPFPYSLYYRFHGALLVATLVIHAARNPKLIRDLLSERRV